MGLFVNKDGTITLAAFLLLLGVPLLLSGRWMIAILLIVMGLLKALCQAMDEEIQQKDKEEIRYTHMTAAKIRDEIEALVVDPTISEENRTKCLMAMAVLAKKVAREQRRSKQQRNYTSQYHAHELEGICQQVAYVTMKRFGENDEAMAAALSLHALVAKDTCVRQRHVEEADVFGLNLPVQVMQEALERCRQDITTTPPPPSDEQLSAELQRKACLLLGALADGDADMATKIVEEDGLEAILDALGWFRYHEEVANWGLWAIFVLCYDHPRNKAHLLRLGGIPTICQVMKNIPDSLEVARHGIGVLFDILREVPEQPTDVIQIRNIALSAGLQEVVKRAMDEFHESMEIMMMGQEMLIATGYKGEIPQYKPIS